MLPELADVDARYGQALALSQNGHVAASRALLEDLLAVHPEHVPSLGLLGTLALKAREWEQALSRFDRAVALDPAYSEAHSNRGVVLGQLGRLEEAKASFERALELKPDSASAHFNLGYALLLEGDLERGWVHHEWRHRLPGNPTQAVHLGPAGVPLWRGREPLDGKTILLRSEQGLGDTLQFCRYVGPVADRGAQVLFEVPRPLVSLLADLPGVTQILIQGGDLPACDYHCPLLSLPLAFRTTLDTIPWGADSSRGARSPSSAGSPHGGYLSSDAGKVAEWRARLRERLGAEPNIGAGHGGYGKPLIGLAWSGSTANPNDQARSIPLAEVLAHLPAGFGYVSVQKEIRPADAALFRDAGIASFADDLHDFSDTAALCDCLELVLAVDTSVVHLNGALGNETWVLLPFSASWRWLRERADSPWYPRMRLYRRERTGSWGELLARVAEDLITRFGPFAAGAPGAGAGGLRRR